MPLGGGGQGSEDPGAGRPKPDSWGCNGALGGGSELFLDCRLQWPSRAQDPPPATQTRHLPACPTAGAGAVHPSGGQRVPTGVLRAPAHHALT